MVRATVRGPIVKPPATNRELDAPPSGIDTRPINGWSLLGQTLAAIVVLALVAFAIEHAFATQLRSMGVFFVQRFGLLGFFVGTFVADGFHVPVPAQFYLLALVSSGRPALAPLSVMCIASILAGHVGYRIGGRLEGLPFFHRLVSRSGGKVKGLFARYGVWAVAVGSLTPVPYPILCYLSGLYQIPYGLFSLLTLLRIPRLLFFYYLFLRASHRG